MNNALTTLMYFTVFIVITTVLSVYTKSKHLNIHGFRVQFTVGGILLYIGKERSPSKPRPISGKLHVSFIAIIFLGIVLFYLVFVPEIVAFVRSFVEYTSGTSSVAPQPVMVPVPLLFKFQDTVPYLLIAIGIAVIVHELMHALTALREGITVQSWGAGILFLVPLAFVELNENELQSASTRTKLNIVSAGVFGNAVATIILFLFLLTINAAAPIFIGTPSSAVAITSIDCSVCNTSLCPAKLVGIQPNTIIMAINDTHIDGLDKFIATLHKLVVGSNISLKLCDYSGLCRTLALNLNAHRKDDGSIPCIGASFASIPVFIKNGKPYRLLWLENSLFLLTITLMINFSLFVINAVPLFVTDGALFLKYLTEGSPRLNRIVSMKIVDVLNASILVIAATLSSYLLLLR